MTCTNVRWEFFLNDCLAISFENKKSAKTLWAAFFRESIEILLGPQVSLYIYTCRNANYRFYDVAVSLFFFFNFFLGHRYSESLTEYSCFFWVENGCVRRDRSCTYTLKFSRVISSENLIEKKKFLRNLRYDYFFRYRSFPVAVFKRWTTQFIVVAGKNFLVFLQNVWFFRVSKRKYINYKWFRLHNSEIECVRIYIDSIYFDHVNICKKLIIFPRNDCVLVHTYSNFFPNRRWTTLVCRMVTYTKRDDDRLNWQRRYVLFS